MPKQPGELYLIRSGLYFKIGRTTNFKKRALNYRCCNPDIEILGQIRVEDVQSSETKLHKQLLLLRHPERREWFLYNEEVVKRILSGQSLKGLDILCERIASLRKHFKKEWDEVINNIESTFGKVDKNKVIHDFYIYFCRSAHYSEPRLIIYSE
jgi:hypothetical protein